MRFAELCQRVKALGATSSRTAKRGLLADFLRQLSPEEVPAGVLILTGQIFAEGDARSLNVGWASVRKALEASRQLSLVEEPLTILEVQKRLEAIALASGPESQRAKQRLLQELLERASPEEKEVLLRSISGEMRMGASEGALLDAIAEAAQVAPELVRTAHMFLGDLGRLAQVALTQGAAGLASVELQLLTPVKPMLADLAEDAADALAIHGGTTAVEYKLDGARIQIHRAGDEVRIFSRRLTDVTASVPEVVEWARAAPAKAFLAEGEVVAVDARGRPRPFQEVMRRFVRVHDIDLLRKEVPLRLYLFDLLSLEGRSLMNAPYQERWAALEEVAPGDLRVPRRVTSSAQEIDAFLAEAIGAGHEGLMAKALDAPYAAGKRGKKWLKLKPAETLDLVILAAEWGHGRRTGTLSNYWLGIRDGDQWQMLGKTFKGLTDEQRLELMERLLALKTTEEPWVVHVRPEVVAEVAYNEIQKSPTYPSGFALRFARITRIRDDKGSGEADTYERLKALYQQQFERKGA